MRILGIDYGDKRTGFALSDPLGIIASALKTCETKSMRETIDCALAVVKEHNPVKIVLGLPLNMDGTEGPRAEKTRAFGKNLEKVSGVDVIYKDERLSSVSAEKTLAESGMKREKMSKLVDAVAAQIILQSYLDSKR